MGKLRLRDVDGVIVRRRKFHGLREIVFYWVFPYDFVHKFSHQESTVSLFLLMKLYITVAKTWNYPYRSMTWSTSRRYNFFKNSGPESPRDHIIGQVLSLKFVRGRSKSFLPDKQYKRCLQNFLFIFKHIFLKIRNTFQHFNVHSII